MALPVDDFSLDGVTTDTTGIKGAGKGIKRTWLKAFETAPAQMLCAYGLAKHATLSNEAVWDAVAQPLKSGALFMTEYADEDAERRGVAINRWLKSLYDYLQYQKTPAQKKKNEFIIKENVCAMFYDEIERLLPSVEYCLAPKRQGVSSGAASLRSSAAAVAEVVSTARDPAELERHAAILYKWLDPTKVSRIRMMLSYQGCGGLPYVASVHQLVTACFREYGNKHHQCTNGNVSEVDFQDAVMERHRIGDNGISGSSVARADDFS